MATVDLHKVCKRFSAGAVEALREVDLHVRGGEYLTVLGPSGGGKTTLLRVIAGFEQPERGDVRIGGASVLRHPPAKRGASMVFQTAALFPHLNVYDNLALGLRLRRASAEVVRDRVSKTLERLELASLANRMPGELSGGQRQRVAVARALIGQTRVVLLDEPLSHLDPVARRRLRRDLRRIHRETAATMIHVTHDQVEALSLGERVALIHQGAIVQCDSPADLYDHPATKFAIEFVGGTPVTTFTARASDDGVRISHRTLPLPAAQGRSGRLDVAVRSEHVAISAGEQAAPVECDLESWRLSGTVSDVAALGADWIVEVDTPLGVVASRVTDSAWRPGQAVVATAPLSRLHLFDAHGRALPPSPACRDGQ